MTKAGAIARKLWDLRELRLIPLHLRLLRNLLDDNRHHERVSAELTARAAEIYADWETILHAHGSEIAQLRESGVGETRIRALYPLTLDEWGIDFAELWREQKLRAFLDRRATRSHWHPLAKGMQVVPINHLLVDPSELRYLDVRYQSHPPSIAEFLRLSIVMLRLTSNSESQPFNLELNRLRRYLNFCERITPLLPEAVAFQKAQQSQATDPVRSKP